MRGYGVGPFRAHAGFNRFLQAEAQTHQMTDLGARPPPLLEVTAAHAAVTIHPVHRIGQRKVAHGVLPQFAVAISQAHAPRTTGQLSDMRYITPQGSLEDSDQVTVNRIKSETNATR